MVNIRLTENDLLGENFVRTWLTENGYTEIEQDRNHYKEIVLTAKGNLENIFVQIKTFVKPHRKYKISEFAIGKLKITAKRSKQIAYVAYVLLDENINLIEIVWERLG